MKKEVKKGCFLEQNTLNFRDALLAFIEVGSDGKVCHFCSEIIQEENKNVFYCENKCTAKYCSLVCRKFDSIDRGHLIYCNGLDLQCKNFHEYSTLSSIINLASRLISALICLSIKHCNSVFEFKDVWSKMLREHSSRHMAEFTTAEYHLIKETWILLSSSLQTDKLNYISETFSSQFMIEDNAYNVIRNSLLESITLPIWESLLWNLKVSSVSVILEHPLAKIARELPYLATASMRLQRYRKLQRHLSWTTTPSASSSSIEEKAVCLERNMIRLSQASNTHGEEGLVEGEIDCNPFEPLAAHLIVFHKNFFAFQNSCLPSVHIEASPRNAEDSKGSEDRTLRFVALRNIDDAQQITLNFDGFGKRDCSICSLCIYKQRRKLDNFKKDVDNEPASKRKKDDPVDLLAVQQLVDVGEHFLAESEPGNAESPLQEAVSFLESERIRGELYARALHGLGAAYLGMGQWRRAHSTWLHWNLGTETDTPAACPVDYSEKMLKEQIEKLKAYHHIQRLDKDNGSHEYSDINSADDVELISKEAFLSSQPLVSREQCSALIHEAESLAGSDGWTTDRHYAVPTTDIPLHRLPGALDWFNKLFRDHIGPSLLANFTRNLNGPAFLSVHDAFLVRYKYDHHLHHSNESTESAWEEDLQAYRSFFSNEEHLSIDRDGSRSGQVAEKCGQSQRYLPLHADESNLSIIIPLNEEFIGGGTYFVDLKRVVKAPTGHLLSFRGGLLHGSDPILAGTRYIIAAFLFLDEQVIAENRVPSLLRGSKDTYSRNNFEFTFQI